MALRSAHLHNDIGIGPQCFDIFNDLNACFTIGFISEMRLLTRSAFKRYGKTQLLDLFRSFRGHSDTTFTIMDFLWNSNLHGHTAILLSIQFNFFANCNCPDGWL